MERALFSRKDFAEACGLSVRTVDKLISNNSVKVTRVGRRVLIPARALVGFLKGNYSTTQPKTATGGAQ